MKRTIELLSTVLSTVLFALALLLVTQTTTVSAAENYKQYDNSTYYANDINKKDVKKTLAYTKDVPKEILAGYKATNMLYFTKDLKSIPIDYTKDYLIKNEKGIVIGIVKPTESINSVYITLSAASKEIKTAMLSTVGYYVDTKYYNLPSDEPIFIVFFREYVESHPACNSSSALFAKYFSDYYSKVTLDNRISTYYKALLNPPTTISKVIDDTVAQKCNTKHISSDRWSSITYKQLNDYTIYDDTIDIRKIKEISSWLTFLPTQLINRFYTEGWTLIFSDEVVSSYNKPCGGVTNLNDKIICVKADIEGMAPEILYHELGHYVDYSYSKGTFFSSNADFQQLYYKYKGIYKEEGLRAGQSYAASNEKEFFAVTFQEYYLHSNNLKNQAPEVYSYMDNLNKVVLQ